MNIHGIAPGIYDDISHETYHRGWTDIISNSYLSRLAKCPAKARVLDRETDALMFGRALHAYILDRAQWDGEFFVLPEKLNMRTNAGKEALAAYEATNTGKQIVQLEDYRTILNMNDAVMNNPAATVILNGSSREVTVVWDDEETGLSLKTRPDIIQNDAPGVVFDLKTTRNAAEHPFQTSIVQYGYARQAAMALSGLTAITGKEYYQFGFIALEHEVPYRTEVYVLDDDFLEYGHNEYKRLLRIEKHCREQSFWPNYAPTNLLNLRQVGAHTIMMPGYLSEVWEPR